RLSQEMSPVSRHLRVQRHPDQVVGQPVCARCRTEGEVGWAVPSLIEDGTVVANVVEHTVRADEPAQHSPRTFTKPLTEPRPTACPTSSSTARSSTPTGSTSKPFPRRASRSTCGTPGNPTTSRQHPGDHQPERASPSV